MLLEHGADADDDADNPFGVRPVHAAGGRARPRDDAAPARGGRRPERSPAGGFMPLHEAAHSDDVEMARLLLAHGADPSLAADDGRDSVRIAADDGSSAVASLLAGT